MKRVLTLLFCGVCLFSSAQIGIGTTTPEATLDVREGNPSSPNSNAGIGIPDVMKLPSGGMLPGQIVYLLPDTSVYYFDGNAFRFLNANRAVKIGKLKYGMQTADHSGWFLCNGRDTTGILTESQQMAHQNLDLGAVLPNAIDKVLKMDGTLNQTIGLNTRVLTQDELPAFTIPVTTNNSGNHTHSITEQSSRTTSATETNHNSRLKGFNNDTKTTESSGDHSHSYSVSNGGMSVPFSIEDLYLQVNVFIYLGE